MEAVDVHSSKPVIDRPSVWVARVAPWSYMVAAAIVGAVVGAVLAVALGAPVWVGLPGGMLLATTIVDVAWRRRMPPSADGRWSLWARRRYRRSD